MSFSLKNTQKFERSGKNGLLKQAIQELSKELNILYRSVQSSLNDNMQVRRVRQCAMPHFISDL